MTNLLAEPWRGYRFWRTPASPVGTLQSMVRNIHWTQRELRAFCGHGVCSDCNQVHDIKSDHRAPYSRCSCGIYGVHSLMNPQIHPYSPITLKIHDTHNAPLLGVSAGVIGCVLAWGRIIIPAHDPVGFRAEYARIEALAYCLPRRIWVDCDCGCVTSQYGGGVTFHVDCGRGVHHSVLPFGHGLVPGSMLIDWSREWDSALRQRYPEVAIFNDLEGMAQAFPPPDLTMVGKSSGDAEVIK